MKCCSDIFLILSIFLWKVMVNWNLCLKIQNQSREVYFDQTKNPIRLLSLTMIVTAINKITCKLFDNQLHNYTVFLLDFWFLLLSQRILSLHSPQLPGMPGNKAGSTVWQRPIRLRCLLSRDALLHRETPEGSVIAKTNALQSLRLKPPPAAAAIDQ